MDWYDAKGDAAARLRQRKHALLQRLQLPPDALPGSLALTHRRCGQPNCHCAHDQGHPLWSLTFMVDGKKHVEWIPERPITGTATATNHPQEAQEEAVKQPLADRRTSRSMQS